MTGSTHSNNHTTRDMQRDVMIACLWEKNTDVLRKLILECAPRIDKLGVPGETHKTLQSLLYVANRSTLDAQCVFICFLSADVHLKELLLGGMPSLRLAGMSKEKAELFFTGLDSNIITKWLNDERKTPEELVERTKNYYLVC